MGTYAFLVILLLACPLMMMWMMRGGHGHGGAAENGDAQRHIADGHGHDGSVTSLEELRRCREQLDREIEQREAEEETPTPVGGGWR